MKGRGKDTPTTVPSCASRMLILIKMLTQNAHNVIPEHHPQTVYLNATFIQLPAFHNSLPILLPNYAHTPQIVPSSITNRQNIFMYNYLCRYSSFIDNDVRSVIKVQLCSYFYYKQRVAIPGKCPGRISTISKHHNMSQKSVSLHSQLYSYRHILQEQQLIVDAFLH